MVTETFGDMLFCPESEKVEELPTPESLKHRILISTKPPKEFLEATDDKCSSSQKSQVSDVDDDSWSDDRSFKVLRRIHTFIFVYNLKATFLDLDIYICVLYICFSQEVIGVIVILKLKIC